MTYLVYANEYNVCVAVQKERAQNEARIEQYELCVWILKAHPVTSL